MESFVTGATGFIGRHLVPHLLARGERVHVLVRRELAAAARGAARALGRRRASACTPWWATCRSRGSASPRREIAALRGRIDHFFHLAALYDMEADADSLRDANVDGTRHAVELAEALEAGCVHHVSSIAAAGRYPGTFREDMFEEAEGLDDPYFATKHESRGHRARARARGRGACTGRASSSATASPARSTRSTAPTTSSSCCGACARSRRGCRCSASKAA